MNSFDSGKTQLATRLIKALSETSHTVEYFKPLSGHNYWYDFEHTKNCMKEGVLYSKDAKTVRAISNPKSPIELANPIHSLFVPMRIERPLQTLPNTLGLAGSNSILALERFSRPDEEGIDSTILTAQKLFEEERLIIGLEEVGKLTRNASIYEVNSLEAVQEFEHQNYEQHVSESFAHLEGLADVVIIEGFNNSAWPWDGLDSVDAVLVVGPAHVFSYDPKKFKKAVYLMIRGQLPTREVTFGRISDLLKPIKRLEVIPETDLTSFELKELGLDFHTRKKD